MSDRDESDEIIKNDETRTRRDWVDRALTGVRRRLELGEALPEADDEAETEPAPRPQLYVVTSSRKR